MGVIFCLEVVERVALVRADQRLEGALRTIEGTHQVVHRAACTE
jgi:hypothetical protein